MLGSSTLAVMPVNRSIQAWLSTHATEIAGIADILGVPATSIAAPLVQEAGGIIFDGFAPSAPFLTGPTRLDDPLRLDSLHAYKEQIFDEWLDEWVQQYSHQDIAQDFSNKSSEIAGRPGSVTPSGVARWLEKITSPTANDLGWGNVNLGTAISELQNYLHDPHYAGDPLHLKQYESDYRAFARDLVDPHAAASFAISGLIAREGQDYYTKTYGEQYTTLPDQAKAALSTTYFKQGDTKIREHFVDPIAPTVPDPARGDGGPDIMDKANWQILLKSLGIASEHGPRPHADVAPTASAALAANASAPIADNFPPVLVAPLTAVPPAPKRVEFDAAAGPQERREGDARVPDVGATSFSPAVSPQPLGSLSDLYPLGAAPDDSSALSIAGAGQGAVPRGDDDAVGPGLTGGLSSPTLQIAFPQRPVGDPVGRPGTTGADQRAPEAKAEIGLAIPPLASRKSPVRSPMESSTSVPLPQLSLGPPWAARPDGPAGAISGLRNSTDLNPVTKPSDAVAPLRLPEPGRLAGEGGRPPWPAPIGATLLPPENSKYVPDSSLSTASSAVSAPPGLPGSGWLSRVDPWSPGSIDWPREGAAAADPVATAVSRSSMITTATDPGGFSSHAAPALSMPPAERRFGNGSTIPHSPSRPGRAAPPPPGQAAAPSSGGGGVQGAAQGGSDQTEVELDHHMLGSVVLAALDRSTGGPNTGPASVNSSQIYTPAGVTISGYQ
jgi:hypothetical protein